VSKRRDAAYRPRSARAAWVKTRAVETREALVGGVIGPLRRPDSLILGLVDERGRLRVAGRTTPLTPAERARVGNLLDPPDGVEHPWPPQLPSSRVGLLPGDRVDYTPVAPELVVEILADTAFARWAWRHPVKLVRPRPDLAPDDLAAPSAGGAHPTEGGAGRAFR
jgi:ATP-dependent DNA ligase